MESWKDKSAIVTIFMPKKLIASFKSRELDFTDFKSGRGGKEEEEGEEEDSRGGWLRIKAPSLGVSDGGPPSKARLVLNADDVAGLGWLQLGRGPVS